MGARIFTQAIRHKDGTISHVVVEQGPRPGTIKLRFTKPRKCERDGVVLSTTWVARVQLQLALLMQQEVS